MKMSIPGICNRCKHDKSSVHMFFQENIMYPGPNPDIMQGLSVEQQLISRISPAVQVHMLKHGGIAASGYCVAFPQNINEPTQILSNLLQQIIHVRIQGKNDTT